MRTKGWLTWLAGCSAATAAALAGGCIIVVDRDSDSSWTSEEHLPRRCLGVNLERPGSAVASQLALDRDRTSLVTYVHTGSPAEQAGLRKYDVITRIDGDESASPARVREVIRAHKAGDEVRLGVIREGKPIEVTATLRD